MVWGAPHPVAGIKSLYYTTAYVLFRVTPPGYSSWLDWLYASHPDWIVYKNDGTTIAYEYGSEKYVPFDITNDAARAYYMGLIEAAAKGYQGVAFDNVSAGNAFGASVIYAHPTNVPCAPAQRPSCGGEKVRKWSGATDGSDLAFVRDNLDYLHSAHAALHKSGLALFCNSNESQAFNPAPLQVRAAAACDGSMAEGFVYVGCSAGAPRFFLDKTWSQIEASNAVDAKGWWFAVAYTCNDDVTNWSEREADWTIANYLLVIGNPANNYLSVGPERNVNYVNYPSYMSPPIGVAKEPPPPPDCAPNCRRRYSNGFVFVDPSWRLGTGFVTRAPDCRDLWGRAIAPGRHAIAPGSAVVVVGCRS